MFDNNQFNNMNNGNRNFNNQSNDNLINDNFNAINANNSVYQGMQPWQQTNSIQSSLKTDDDNYSTLQNNLYNPSSYVNNNVDVPPELGEIKNLNEATISSAPTMDVLGPMNIMPDKLPNQNDPLDAYENGSLNLNSLNNSSNYKNDFNQSSPSDFNNTSSTFKPNNLNSNFSGIPLGNNLNNFNNNLTGMPFGNNINGFDNNFNNNFNNNSTSINPLPSQFNSLNKASSVNAPISDLNKIPSFNSSVPNINKEDSFNSMNDNFSLSQSIDSQDIKQDSMTKLMGENESNALKQEVLPDFNSFSLNKEKDQSTTSELDFNKKNDLNTNEKENDSKPYSIDDKSSLNDLGIDDDYEEPDSLEIMDLDSSKDEENDDLEDSNKEENEVLNKESEPKLVMDDVEKIKSLIENLKKSGSNIEIEEFDFEEMYQLIIKLKK